MHLYTTGNGIVAVCLDICRVLNIEHTAKALFAVCQHLSPRQSIGTRRRAHLPCCSAPVRNGIGFVCRVPYIWHTANETAHVGPNGCRIFAVCGTKTPGKYIFLTCVFVFCRVRNLRHTAKFSKKIWFCHPKFFSYVHTVHVAPW